jgi:hypothetical protein
MIEQLTFCCNHPLAPLKPAILSVSLKQNSKNVELLYSLHISEFPIQHEMALYFWCFNGEHKFPVRMPQLLCPSENK